MRGFVMVYSITTRKKLSDLIDRMENLAWLKRTAIQNVPLVLVGTKDDREEGERQAREWGCSFFEASGITRHNVEEIFASIVDQITNKKISSELKAYNYVKVYCMCRLIHTVEVQTE